MLLYRLCNGLLYLECRIRGRSIHRSIKCEVVTVHRGPYGHVADWMWP